MCRGSAEVSQRGFTLIEMLVVVALIGLMTVLALPSLSSYFQLSVNSATRDLASTAKETFNSTVITGRVYRMVYDLKKQAYWVESAPTGTLIETEETLKKRAQSRFKSDKKEDPAESPFQMAKEVTKKALSLPRGVEFADVLTQKSDDPIATGLAYTHFFPSGMTERTLIRLVDRSQHKVSLVISSLMGTTDVYDRWINREEAFGK